jgi:hypothetical protein
MSHSGCSFLSGQSYPACPFLPVLLFQSCSTCPVLFCVSCSAYPTLPIPFCLSSSACPVQDPCFPPAKRLWALKLDFNCGERKKREFALFFFCARRFRFFSRFFSSRFRALFLASRSRAQKPEKSPGAHLCMSYEKISHSGQQGKSRKIDRSTWRINQDVALKTGRADNLKGLCHQFRIG